MTSPIDRLAALKRVQEDAAVEVRAQVAAAREQKHSWREIGTALGISPQGACKRFSPRPDWVEELPLSDPLFDPLFTHKD